METLATPWRCSVVVKLLGRMISLPAFDRLLRQIWNLSAEMVVLDLPNDYFLVRFEKDSDLQVALMRGPWMMFGHYMLIKQWDPLFNPPRQSSTQPGVWIRISGLPLMLYEKNIMFDISSTIGRPIQIDEATMLVTIGRFARVCVEVDLLKPLKGVIYLNGERLNIEYEGLHIVCYSCGTYGHLVDRCPLRTQEKTSPDVEMTPEAEQIVTKSMDTVPVPATRSVGEWMTLP